MKSVKNIAATLAGTALAAMFLALSSCHDLAPVENTRTGNLQQLWTIVDEHYCFLDEKGVDWSEVKRRYEPAAAKARTQRDLFRVMATMLEELRDGHVNLISSFETSYYRKWWSDYPQNFDLRLIQQNYFNFKYLSLGGITYGWLPERIGYMLWPSFDYSLGPGNIDSILAYFAMADGLIIDIRDNGGGSMDNADDLIRHFIDAKTVTGYIRHKTGPGHSDFSEPFAMTVDPLDKRHIVWSKPVIVLTNRSTFSAANYFTAAMKSLPFVRVVGSTTGGGCGMPFSSELSCGWGVRFSACPVYDPSGALTEFGVDPSPGCAVDMDPAAALTGRDSILDYAVALLTTPK